MQYRVYLSTKIKADKLSSVTKGSCMIVIEPDDYSAKEIKDIKNKGYKVLGYISIGTLEKERPWFNKYKKYRLKQLEDWKNEWYMDMTRTNWRQFLISRAKTLKAKGFDGYWCDNLDVYEYNKSTKMFAACKAVLKQIKAVGGYVMVNGGSEWFDVAIDKKVAISKIVNGVTQEEVFSLIKNYSGTGKFGSQTKSQSSFYQSLLKKLLKNGVQTFLLEYTKSDDVKKKIKDFCTKYKMTGYYISSSVNL